MSDDEIDIDLDALEKRMDGAMNALKGDFSSLRTGRASASMLDAIMVDLFDVGARYYTFIWTLYLCMKAAERAG